MPHILPDSSRKVASALERMTSRTMFVGIQVMVTQSTTKSSSAFIISAKPTKFVNVLQTFKRVFLDPEGVVAFSETLQYIDGVGAADEKANLRGERGIKCATISIAAGTKMARQISAIVRGRGVFLLSR